MGGGGGGVGEYGGWRPIAGWSVWVSIEGQCVMHAGRHLALRAGVCVVVHGQELR